MFTFSITGWRAYRSRRGATPRQRLGSPLCGSSNQRWRGVGLKMALQPSRSNRAPPIAGHIPQGRIVLFADDEALGRLAATDLSELTTAQVVLVSGGTQAWVRARFPVVASPEDPPDAERIDYIFWNHDRHAGNEAAMRAYLQWETELPAQIAAEGLSGFRLVAR